jgi:hypothetical protein
MQSHPTPQRRASDLLAPHLLAPRKSIPWWPAWFPLTASLAAWALLKVM